MSEAYELIFQQVQQISVRLAVTPQRALAVWYGVHALRLEEQEALDAASFDGGNDRGIDLWVVDDDLERVIIGQTKLLTGRKKAPTPAELSLLFATMEELQDAQDLLDAGRIDLAEAADALREARDKGYSVQLQLIYTGAKSVELERKIRQFNRKHLGDNISSALFAMEDLDLVYADYHGSAGRIDRAIVPLVSGAHHEEQGQYGKSLVASVPGTSLRELYRLHGNKLFDQNVRLFLGARKGSVNGGIRETINNPEE